MKADGFILHPAFVLSLADGTRLTLCAGDETAARVLDFLARAAALTPRSSPLREARGEEVRARRLLVVTDVGQIGNLPSDAVCVLAAPDAPGRRQRKDLIRARVENRRPDPEPPPPEQWFWQQLARLSAAIAREVQPRGGVLLHSGLAAYPHPRPLSLPGRGESAPSPQGGEGRGEGGILLAGPSGVGKSTAARRLPPPWRALADDATLVVRDLEGNYWAHPWPTWTRLLGPKAGDGRDTWDVQRAVPLRAIFVLEQGDEDRVEPLGPGHAVALLSELAQQTSTYLVQDMPHAEIAAFHCQRFDNLCALARAVPAYLLHVSLTGAFWTVIEGVL